LVERSGSSITTALALAGGGLARKSRAAVRHGWLAAASPYCWYSRSPRSSRHPSAWPFRRQGSANGKTSAPAPFEPTNWQTVWLDHISFEVSNYKETVAFYTALLGWKPGTDEGSQNQCEIGDVGGIIIRRGGGGNRGGGAGTTPPARRAGMGHIAFGITPFDPDQVKMELEKRGLTASPDTGGRGDIHTAAYKSYHTTTPNGYNLQISATTRANRAG